MHVLPVEGVAGAPTMPALHAMSPPFPMRLALSTLLFFGLLACDERSAGPAGWQGVVEYAERTLAFEVPGTLASVSVREGDRLPAETEIARLDDTLERLARNAREAEARAVRAELELIEAGTRPEDIESVKASLRAARAELELAEQNLGRERTLTEQGLGTTAALDQARTAATSAKEQQRQLQATLRRLRGGARDEEIAGAAARLDAAEAAVALGDARIARHVLQMDEAGFVLEVHAEPGEVVPAAAPVVTLGDVAHPYVDVFVPQAKIGDVTLGDAVEVRVDAREDHYPAVVEHIGRRTEFTPRFLFSDRERPNLVIRVRVRVDVPDADLPAGVPAFVTPAEDRP